MRALIRNDQGSKTFTQEDAELTTSMDIPSRPLYRAIPLELKPRLNSFCTTKDHPENSKEEGGMVTKGIPTPSTTNCSWEGEY